MRSNRNATRARPTISRSAGLALGLGLTLIGAGAGRADIDIATAPLFVMPPVIPALMLAIDDSGSMDSEVLMRANDGALWWNTKNRSFTGLDMNDRSEDGVINFNRTGEADNDWKKFVYLFPNGTGLTSGRRAYGDSTHDHFAVPPIAPFAFSRSPEFNLAYFDPARLYEPWPSQGGYTFADADPAGARTDPTRGGETYTLTDVSERRDSNEVFRMFPGMVIPAGTRYRDWDDSKWKMASNDRPIEIADMPNPKDLTNGVYRGEGRGVPISFYPATFYLSVKTPLPDGFGYDPRKIAGGVDTVDDGLAPDGSRMIRYEIRRENFVSQAAYDAAIRNFANWFTYYHKRHVAARGAIGAAFKDIEGFRIGTYRINSRPNPATNLAIRNLSNSADRTAFFKQVYEDLNSGGTPSREAVDYMRSQFKRTDANAPIQEACQMNFGVLLTDGYANNWTGAGVGNRDGGFPAPFKDSVFNTMADIAMDLYQTNPRGSLPKGLVPVPVACHVSDPDPRIDCNNDLHVNLFALSLGTTGTIFNVDLAATADPFTNHPTWPTSFSNRNPVHVDDLWHATLNSRGELVDVSVPADLGQRFTDVLAEIAARLETSATAAAASSAVLQSDTQLFVAGFRSTDWSGELKSYALGDKGVRGEVLWDAEARLATSNRKFFTSSGGDGVVLDWGNLSNAQKQALNRAPDGTKDGAGEKRIAWLRGTDNGDFRSRSDTGTKRLLGDIVYSNPQFVGQPDYGYNLIGGEEGAAYRAYRATEAYRKRPSVLYVGANDGLLHAFDATSGVELFAYLPSELLQPAPDEDHARINLLMDRNYAHRFFVDGTPTIGDAYIGRAWKTILVGSLGAGGRSVFALDVTSPAAFTSSAVLWEFTDEDLGENVGQPEIVRMRNGEWAAVFGNGYNSDSQHAILFVVRLSDGALLAKIDTETGSDANPNGLASPRVTDLPEGDLSASYIYAGDLHGNLWRFDVSDDNIRRWGDPSLVFSTGDIEESSDHKSAKKKDKPDDDDDRDDEDDDRGDEIGQPITSRPNLASHPEEAGKIMVLFGTGSYFRVDDAIAQDPQVQSLYGLIEDLGNNPSDKTRTRDTLLKQSITWEEEQVVGDASVSVREVSDLELEDEDGWYLDLVPPDGTPVGERVVSMPTFPSGVKQERVRFTTLIPDPDPCGTARGGFVMDIRLLSGGRAGGSVFDLDDDGQFDDDDLVDDRTISGIGGSQGEELTVVRSPDGGIDYLYGGRNRIIASENAAGAIGRQSWRQLR